MGHEHLQTKGLGKVLRYDLREGMVLGNKERKKKKKKKKTEKNKEANKLQRKD